MCTLVFVDYMDGNIGPYHEFGVSVMVRHHTAGPPTHSMICVRYSVARASSLSPPCRQRIHPGRGPWHLGFPKEIADVDARHAGSVRRGVLHQNGR